MTTRHKMDIELCSDRQIRLTRVFEAPAEFVFRAWTEPRFVRRWWICDSDGSSMPRCEVDLKVGGHWHWVTQVGPHAFGFYGTYQEIERPNRLVYTENFDPTASLELVSFEAADPSSGSLVVLELIEKDGRTVAISTATYPSQEIRDLVLSTGMENGAALAYDRLAELVEGESPAVLTT